jgi:fermentation-respiration switch protein FrsA (DUF1100 family)
VICQKRRIKRFLTLLQITVSLLFFYSKCYSIKPDREYIKTPQDLNLNFESVTFNTSDNYKLFGWFIHSEQDSPNVTIIFSMLDGGNMSYIVEMTEYFVHNNFNVLLYDYRGFGKSQDFNIERDMLIYPEFLTDLDAAIDFVKSKNDDKIILFGFSMGATVSIGVAGQRDDISAVIADGAYTKTDEVVKLINQKYEMENSERRIQNVDNYPHSAQPIKAIETFLNTGLFILTGLLDKIITPEMAYKIYTKCPSLQKSIWIASDTKHCRIHEKYGNLYFNLILSFIQQTLTYLNYKS